VLPEQFDIIYTGVGALGWLPDIAGWARVVAALLAPGGLVYVREAHPLLWALDDERDDEELVLRYPYFETDQPLQFKRPRPTPRETPRSATPPSTPGTTALPRLCRG